MNQLRKAIARRSTGSPEEEGSAAEEVASVEEAHSPFARKVDCALEDFEIGVTLGTGTFGRVCLARFKRAADIPHAQNYYALKILRKAAILQQRQLLHIKNETVLLSVVEHPFIVNLVNHFQDDARLMMVLEFVPGGELFSYLREETCLPNEEARFFAAQVVLVFGYLHSRNIAYRDLKPENLLIDRDGYLKLADFGFAKIVTQRAWTLCGTPEYLAPEIIQGKGHGPPVDWWACGVLIYEMLVGFPPFYDDNAFGIYQKILAVAVEYPRHLDSKAINLMKKFLTPDLTKRIGCLKGGVTDIQKSKWFAKVNWKGVYNRTEPVKFLPNVKSEGDTDNFDEYPDAMTDPYEPLLSPEQQALFAEFDTIGFKGDGGDALECLQQSSDGPEQ